MSEKYLPPSWKTCTIGEVFRVTGGGTPKSKDPNNFCASAGIPWITPADLSGYKDIFIERGSRDLSQEGYSSCGAKIMPKGTVLFSSRAPIGYVAISKNNICTNQGFKSMPPVEQVDPKYLYYYLKQIKEKANQLATGTTFKELSGKATANLPLVLAPLNEQRRIADKLDTTLAAVEVCKQKLNNAAETIQRFRQSVLAAAVSGELTREWREERGITTEWETQPIENVADARLGKMLDKSKNTGPERKYIGNINVRWFEFDLSNLATIRVSDEEFQKLSLQPGDLLVCEGGEPGRCAVWEQGTTPITYQKALHRIRPKPNIDSHFLSFCFKNAAEDGSLQKLFTGSTIKHLTGRSLSKFLVPVPSKQEQEMVISKTLALLEVASTIESKIFQTKSVLNRLTSAILSKAFRGDLVPQDPNDEPASVLLERIKAQRAAEAATKKPVKRGRKKKADTAQLVIPEGIADNHLAKVLEECGPLSERALLAASELEPGVFQLQLSKELKTGALKQVDVDGEAAYADAAWEEEK